MLSSYISAESSRLAISVFGPTQRRFLLPEQPGSYNPRAIQEHTLITQTYPGAIEEHTLERASWNNY